MRSIFRKLAVIIAVIILAVPFLRIRSQAETDYITTDELLAENVNKYHVPGMAVMEVNKDGILFQGTYGECTDIDQVFIIGSLSKSFTATAIMQLVEAGSVDLDEPISKYIDCDEWFAKGTDYERITVRNLLNQTGGITTYAKLGELKSNHSFGSYEYANANYGLLGLIVESVSGMTYEEYLKNNIFDPLGMSRSYASYSDEMRENLIPGNRNYFGFWVSGEPDYPKIIARGQWTNIPAGYIASSASDMGRYLQMYLREGEEILKKSSIDKMFYENTSEGNGAYYGMGWECAELSDGEYVLQHMGLVENYASFMYIYPEQHKAGIVLANMNDYLVDNNYLGNIVAPLTGTNGDDKSDMYVIYHLLINLILVVLLLVAVYPVAAIKRWMDKRHRILVEIFRHFVLPAALLIIARFVAPFFVIRLFAKDVWIVLLVSTATLLIVGVIKLAIIINCKRMEGKSSL